MNPFDEMVAGAVLAHAQRLKEAGVSEGDLWFCSLDKDLAGRGRDPSLFDEYAALGLNVLQSFEVPR